jgi:hypothetical protein
MRTSLIAVTIAMAASAASAQGTQDSPNRTPLMFEVAARGYLSGGRTGSMAGDSASDRLDSYVWADQTLCGMGAGDQPSGTTPWVGWHFTGTVLADVPGEMTVRIDWKRVWENGVKVQNGAGGTQTIKLRNGERVELDRITPANPGGCGTIEAKLEAAVTSRASYFLGVARGGGRGVLSGVGAGARGGAAGRGAGAGVGSGTGTGTDATGTLQKNARTLRLIKQGPYDAEIWLVHKKPDGTEVVQQQIVRFGAAPKPFVFPPEEVPGGGGAITVDIAGSLQLNGPGYRFYNFSNFNFAQGYGGRGAATGQFARADPPTPPSPPARAGQAAASAETPATPRFMLSIARHARRTTPFVDTRGATDMSLEMPKPGDVLSFELPPLQKATEDLLKGHTFSIRVRITEVK